MRLVSDTAIVSLVSLRSSSSSPYSTVYSCGLEMELTVQLTTAELSVIFEMATFSVNEAIVVNK